MVRIKDIVIVQKIEISPMSRFQAAVGRSRPALTLLVININHRDIPCQGVDHISYVLATIIHHNNFQIGVGLLRDGFQRIRK